MKVLDPAVRAKMKAVKEANEYVLKFCYKPEVTVDDQGLIHASVYMTTGDSGDEPSYDLTAQVVRAGNSIDAKVISIAEYRGLRGSVTVH